MAGYVKRPNRLRPWAAVPAETSILDNVRDDVVTKLHFMVLINIRWLILVNIHFTVLVLIQFNRHCPW